MMSDAAPNSSEKLSLELLRQGDAALQRGDYKESLANLLEAFVLNHGNLDIQTKFIEVLGYTGGLKLPKPVTDILAEAVITNEHNAQALAPVLAGRFEGDPDIDRAISFLEETPPGSIVGVPADIDFTALLGDQLFLLVCTKATSVSPDVERLLCALREHFLGEWLADASSQSYFLDNHPDALAATACQAFNSEYIYAFSAEEQKRFRDLQASIAEDIRGIHPFELAIMGTYRSLWETLKDSNPDDLQYLAEQSPRWPGWLRLIWNIQFLAPFQEALIKQRLAQLTPIQSAHTEAMAKQYEDYPYPRWQSTKASSTAITLKQHIEARFPYIQHPEPVDGPVDILVAGCGTGQQVVQLASNLEYKNILAVDLSQNSLAYANRKTEEKGLTNVHFAQADILALASWDASFDLIVCTGVLHHMAKPSDGLASLLSVSKKNTVFSLALYSERGRAHVVAARKLIAEHKIPDTLEGMRKFRTIVRELPAQHAAKTIANSREFYSASGLHDFAFNAHETRITPLELKALLDEHNLQFIGFDLPRGDYATRYKTNYPDDPNMVNLDHWDKFEKEVPDVFEGMLQFWCIKKMQY